MEIHAYKDEWPESANCGRCNLPATDPRHIHNIPGPRLVANLEAAELLYEALKYEDMRPCPCRHMEARCSRCSALAAWDSARSEKEE